MGLLFGCYEAVWDDVPGMIPGLFVMGYSGAVCAYDQVLCYCAGVVIRLFVFNNNQRNSSSPSPSQAKYLAST